MNSFIVQKIIFVLFLLFFLVSPSLRKKLPPNFSVYGMAYLAVFSVLVIVFLLEISVIPSISLFVMASLLDLLVLSAFLRDVRRGKVEIAFGEILMPVKPILDRCYAFCMGFGLFVLLVANLLFLIFEIVKNTAQFLRSAP